VYVYRVVEVREKMTGRGMSATNLEKLLNEHAQEGWRLRSITSTEVTGPPQGCRRHARDHRTARVSPAPRERVCVERS
jgi:uncharacterized protein DUF4177